MNLWSVKVTDSESVAVPSDRDLLITAVALAPGSERGNGPCFVWLNNLDLDQRYLIGTLRRLTCEQLVLDINVAAFSTFSVSITGGGPVYFSGYYNRLDFSSDSDEAGHDSEDEDEEIDSDEFGGTSSDEDDDGDALSGANWGRQGKQPWASKYYAEIGSSEEEDSDLSADEAEARALSGRFGRASDSDEDDSLDSAEEEAMLQQLNQRLIQLNNMPDEELERTIQAYMSKYPSDSENDSSESDNDDQPLFVPAQSFTPSKQSKPTQIEAKKDKKEKKKDKKKEKKKADKAKSPEPSPVATPAKKQKRVEEVTANLGSSTKKQKKM